MNGDTFNQPPNSKDQIKDCSFANAVFSYSTDLNGLINIGRRFLEQVLRNSSSLDNSLNFGDAMPSG